MIKKFIYIISFCIISQLTLAAGSDSSSDSDSYLDKYKSAKNLVKRAKKLETKGKTEKALKLYNSAYEELLEANKIESRNPDILNYLGFTLRKTGKFEQAEKYYLQGLKIKPNHNGINEYLGELYITLGKMNKANEMLLKLETIAGTNSMEYRKLKTAIDNS